MGVINFSDEISQEKFETLFLNDCIIEFFTPWCTPCKNIVLYLNDLTELFPGIKFISIDITKSRWIQEKYPFFGVPTFFFIQNGEIIKKFTAGLNKKKMIEIIEKYFRISRENI